MRTREYIVNEIIHLTYISSNGLKNVRSVPVMVKILPIRHDVVTTTTSRARNNISNSFGDNLLRK